MELLTAIQTRASSGRLAAPGPSPEHLALILGAAGRAPDHGRLQPWRFIVLDTDLRVRFASAASAAKRLRMPSMTDADEISERAKILSSPTIVVVGCAVQRDNTKIPEIEQVAATAAAMQNFFLAAHGLGYGVMWKTGPAAYDAGVKNSVGLRATDHILGIMHLGMRVK